MQKKFSRKERNFNLYFRKQIPDVDYLGCKRGGKYKIIVELKAINIMLVYENMTKA